MEQAPNGDDRFSAMSTDVIRSIASNLSPGDISVLCRASRRFNREICKNPSFWIQLIRTKFPGEEENINEYQETRFRPFGTYTYHPIKFKSWLDYYYFLHKKYDTIRYNKQIKIAADILRHPDYASKSERGKQVLRRLLETEGLSYLTVRSTLRAVSHDAQRRLPFRSFYWKNEAVSLKEVPIGVYPISTFRDDDDSSASFSLSSSAEDSDYASEPEKEDFGE